jgi:predicted DNA-binding transcriptional regulator YafY
MSRHGIIRRYTLEIEKIERGQFPSFQELKGYLYDHGFEISKRTLQRDIENIRWEFGIEICYNAQKNGYFIDEENSVDLPSFFRFLEIVNTAELLTETLADSKENMKYISFDQGGGLKGIQNLRPLLEAIKDHRKVKFNHLNFHTGKNRKFAVRPYLLKEYNNRWYLVGTISNSSELRTFGVDRMENLEVLTDVFKPNKKINAQENFDEVIGLVYSESDIEEVVLSLTPLQGMYVKSLPMHSSQKVLIDDEKECRVSLRLRPNFELVQQLLMHGERVRVIEPKWLVEEIKNSLEISLKHYRPGTLWRTHEIAL